MQHLKLPFRAFASPRGDTPLDPSSSKSYQAVTSPGIVSGSFGETDNDTAPEYDEGPPPDRHISILKTLYVGNISPTTSPKFLQRLFQRLPGFAGFRMVRHPTNPIAFIDFFNPHTAKRVLKQLQQNPVIVEGRTLLFRRARAVRWHPNDFVPTEDPEPEQPLDKPLDEIISSPSLSTRTPVPPSNSLFIHYGSSWWTAPSDEVKANVSKLRGFRTMRFRRDVRTTAFADFNSIESATQAMEAIRAMESLGTIQVSYATPMIVRQRREVLFLSITRVPDLKPPDVEKVFQKFSGFSHAERLPRKPGNRSQSFLAIFDTSNNAAEARRAYLRGAVSLRGLVHVDYADQDPARKAFPTLEPDVNLTSSPEPTNTLYVWGFEIQHLRDVHKIQQLFHSRPGCGNFFVAKLAKFKQHHQRVPWGLATFDTPENATAAMHALNGRPWGQQALTLKVAYKSDPAPEARTGVRTNVLFANCVFGTTQDEFREAFVQLGGFAHAVLYPDGYGGFAPYGKVIFKSVLDATNALRYIETNPIRLGTGELPIELEPLHLKGRRHWKFRLGYRNFGDSEGDPGSAEHQDAPYTPPNEFGVDLDNHIPIRERPP